MVSSFEDGSSFLKADYAIDCHASDRSAMLAYAFASIAFCACSSLCGVGWHTTLTVYTHNVRQCRCASQMQSAFLFCILFCCSAIATYSTPGRLYTVWGRLTLGSRPPSFERVPRTSLCGTLCYCGARTSRSTTYAAVVVCVRVCVLAIGVTETRPRSQWFEVLDMWRKCTYIRCRFHSFRLCQH